MSFAGGSVSPPRAASGPGMFVGGPNVRTSTYQNTPGGSSMASGGSGGIDGPGYQLPKRAQTSRPAVPGPVTPSVSVPVARSAPHGFSVALRLPKGFDVFDDHKAARTFKRVSGLPDAPARSTPATPKKATKSKAPIARSSAKLERSKADTYVGYDATTGDRSKKARDDDKRCKPRPEDNKPRGGGGGSREFIPWCK